MMWWSEGYPGKLMRLFGDEPEAKEAMADFHKDCKAFWKAKDTPQPMPLFSPQLSFCVPFLCFLTFLFSHRRADASP